MSGPWVSPTRKLYVKIILDVPFQRRATIFPERIYQVCTHVQKEEDYYIAFAYGYKILVPKSYALFVEDYRGDVPPIESVGYLSKSFCGQWIEKHDYGKAKYITEKHYLIDGYTYTLARYNQELYYAVSPVMTPGIEELI